MDRYIDRQMEGGSLLLCNSSFFSMNLSRSFFHSSLSRFHLLHSFSFAPSLTPFLPPFLFLFPTISSSLSFRTISLHRSSTLSNSAFSLFFSCFSLFFFSFPQAIKANKLRGRTWQQAPGNRRHKSSSKSPLAP